MSLSERLSSLQGTREEAKTPKREESPDGSQLVQRCVIIQRDEKGYGLTVSGDNPVFVQSVKTDGAAARAGVQQHDRIIKVNGTLVTSRNHIDVVKLIKSGSYVALTLLGKPPPTGSAVKHASFRDSSGGRITAPQPVDPEKDRELWQQKVHTLQAMYEQAKEDYEKIQKSFLKNPSEKLHAQLIEKEKTLKKLDTQLKQLGGSVPAEPLTPGSIPSPGHPSVSDPDSMDPTTQTSWQQQPVSQRGGARHQKQASVPVMLYKTGESKDSHRTTQVSRSKSDVTSRRLVSLSTQPTQFIGLSHGRESFPEVVRWGRRKLKRAASVPISGSDGGSVSDSPHTSPSISPTPTHPSNCHPDEGNGSGRGDSGIEDGVIPASQQNIITIDDEDFNSEEEQLEGSRHWSNRPVSPFLHRLQALEGGDPGPFGSITTLEKKPAHLAIFLHYLISNSDPSFLFFYIVADMYSHVQGNVKDLRKWAYEIHSTFLVQNAPLKVELTDVSLVNTIDCVLTQSSNENSLRPVFELAKNAVKVDIAELLVDFCNKKDLGLGSIYGVHELEDVMDKNKEQKLIDKYLSPHLERCTKDNVRLGDRDQAIGWALATFFRFVGVTKNPSIERTQSFVMKDKRVIKLPGKSNKTKQFRGHTLNLTHFVTTTFCNKCHGLIWGVGTQGYQCQICEMNVHRQCSEDLETCAGKQKKSDRDKKRASAVIPVVPFPRKGSHPIKDGGQETGKDGAGDVRPELNIVTQPAKREDETDLSGLPAGHGVKSIIERYETPKSPTDNPDPSVEANHGKDRELGRSESMKGREVTKSKKSAPARRAKSDLEVDDQTVKSLNQSGSSSTSSLSSRGVESPCNSSETVNDMIANDSDLDVEMDLPSLKSIIDDSSMKKLKPKEKKRQEVLNELLYTERCHVRSLKILDQLFYRSMVADGGTNYEMARALFPNLKQMIDLHREMNGQMRKRRQENAVIPKIADILLSRFDGDPGKIFQQACAEYCRNQAYALETLKKHQRKEQRLSMILNEAESSPLCRRLQLKDLVPGQMQRLTKYPLLLDNLMKHTQASSDEHNQLKKAWDRSKQILAFVNQAVKDCENFHRLRNLQKRLDKKPVENLSSHHSYEEMKNLELTQHKLVHDGILSMKLRSHRMMEVHVVLLEDIMVLLQKQDEKLILCQSNAQSSRGGGGGGEDKDKYINTHSPLLKLQNLLARNVATDKKAFFVVNTENSGPQIYEFVANTQDERKKWMKYINDSVEAVKQSHGFKPMFIPPIATPPVPNTVHSASQETDTIAIRREQITRVSTTPPHEASKQPSQIGSETADVSQTSESALIHPDEVHISGPVVGRAEQVLTPIEKLRRNDETLEWTLEEREKIIAEIHGLPREENRGAPEVASGNHDDTDDSSVTLITAAQDISCRLAQLVINSSGQVAPSSSNPTQTPHSSAARAEPPKVTIPIPMEQLRDMATRMNQILTKLLSAVNNQDEEKEGLREELRQAQEKLNSLKDIQRAVMGGTLPHSPQSRPSSIVSVGSSVIEDNGDIEGGAAQVPSVHEVADSLREQAQEVMSAVGVTQQDDAGMKIPTPRTPNKSVSSTSSYSEPVEAPSDTSNMDDTPAGTVDSDHEYEDITDILPPPLCPVPLTPASNNNIEGVTLESLNVENSKIEIVLAAEQFADKAEIDSVISQDLMSSTLTTDLDEGANDSDSETTHTLVPDLEDFGETDTDSVQKLEGIVLPGGITSEELVSENQTKSSTECEADSEVTSKESAVDPIEI